MAGSAFSRASWWRERVKDNRRMLAGAAVLAAVCCGVGIATVQAQQFTFPTRPSHPSPDRSQTDAYGNKKPMLLQAVQIDYDYNNKRVSAVGNVQI